MIQAQSLRYKIRVTQRVISHNIPGVSDKTFDTIVFELESKVLAETIRYQIFARFF